jgi:hypothetical protein
MAKWGQIYLQKMKSVPFLLFLFAASPFCFADRSARADVSPGDVVDRTNWRAAEGLLPPSVLEWVKKGDYVIPIGKLDYEVGWEAEYLAASERNLGRFSLDGDGGIIDPASGRRPQYVYGFPFPRIDATDPRAAEKIMWNKWHTLYKGTQNNFPFKIFWVGRGGFEREISAEEYVYYYDGRIGGAVANPDRTESKEIARVVAPSYVDGITLLTWRFLDDRPDQVWAYLPALRRVRQATAANRSDGFVGSDFIPDDANIWFGKNQSFTWALIGEQDVLVPTPGPSPQKIRPGERWENGLEWITTADFPTAAYGFMQGSAWKGAPWAPVRHIWVKRPVWVIEGTPRDRYYSFGRHVFYVDRGNFEAWYKIVYDHQGEYRKTVYKDLAPAWNADGSRRFTALSFELASDEKTDHTCVSEAGSAQNLFRFNTNTVNESMFTAGALIRRGK